LDIYRAKSSKPAPILLFFHGGGWRMMSRRDVAYAASTFVEAGVNFVAPEYSLRPKATLREMAEQCRRALLWTHANAHTFNGDSRRIYVGGLSAGAQLAGVLIATDWRAHGLSENAIRGALLVSGIYDVAALAASTVYGYTNIEPTDIAPLSAMHRAESVRAFVTLAWGEKEPPEFARQSRAFAAALDAVAKPHRTFIAPRKNHFEIALELADADSELSRLALEMMRERGT
jgi:arylformamidase